MFFSHSRFLSGLGLAAFCAASLNVAAVQAQTPSTSGGEGSGKIVSSSPSVGDPFNGVDLNTFIGANRFYAAGYTGTRATVANIEGGQIWNGHETLVGRVSQYLYTPPVPPPYYKNLAPNTQGNEFDQHATLVGQILGGNGSTNKQKGVAYGANLWSGGIATDFDGFSGGPNGVYQETFKFSDDRVFAYPYVTAMQTGINGVRADVVNSSWGTGSISNGVASVNDPNGQSDYSITLDGLVRANGTTFVVASGNEGPGKDTISYPASAYNALVVGATTSDTSNPRYGTVASFSSRGPSDASTPKVTENDPKRASVDIVAPGTNVIAANYGGATGGNRGNPNNDLSTTNYFQNGLSGTSVSAPLVAGGAALLVDYGRANFGATDTNSPAINGQVIKAVLMNSADKLAGWDNGQTVKDGHIETTQGLDYAQGAGQLNLSAAYDQYVSGTHDVAGTGGGVGLASLGWDYGVVALDSVNDYRIGNLMGGQNFTATLDWFIDRQYDGIGVDPQLGGFLITEDNGFAYLTLELYYLSGGTQTLVAQSLAQYNNVQHFSVNTTLDGDYLLRVAYNSKNPNSNNPNRYGSDTSQAYGLAWRGTPITAAAGAPEPSAWLLVVLFGGAALVLRWRRRGEGTI